MVAVDVVLALLATWIAFTLRLDALHWPTGAQWWVYGLTPVLALPVCIRFGLYRAICRFTGQAALQATGKAVVAYGIVLLGVLLWRQWPGVPHSLGVLQPLVFLLLVGSSRSAARFWLADLGDAQKKAEGRLLIFGAGTAGVQTASGIAISGQYVLLGFVDDDASKVGRSINGVPVFSPADVHDMVLRQGVTPHLLSAPARILKTAAAVLGKGAAIQRLCSNLQVDISKARHLLGWVPPVSVDEGLRRAMG